MTVILTGGGSGGHITPLLAVAHELKKLKPDISLVYIGQKGDKFGELAAKHPDIDGVRLIHAGKFRRYYGEGWRQLLSIATWYKNTRDFFRVIRGYFESRQLLKSLRPEVIFIKGGFVGVPVGLAAARLQIPYITHDSDAVPGLANRIISRWAVKHAVALPQEVYNYPKDKTVSTGIPLQADFVNVSEGLKQKYRRELEIPAKADVLLIIGGGLGSKSLNLAVVKVLPFLMEQFPDLWAIHVTGQANYKAAQTLYAKSLNDQQRSRLLLKGFVSDVYRYSGAADLIVSRAGATHLAEFAVQAKACIIVPSSFLASGHQLKNASAIADKKAATVIEEASLIEDPNRLAKAVSDLLKNPSARRELSKNIAGLAKPNAAKQLAALLLEQADAR